MAKRQKPQIVETILQYDEKLTKKFVGFLLSQTTLKSLKTHCKALEISCNGIVWLASWIGLIWLLSDKDLYESQLNMLVGLIFDIVVIAVMKAAFRRRRPTACNDMMQLGPDKFSFPSGHASRAVFVALFFILLSPISVIWWMPLMAWCCAVCLSRIIIQRHYILDVVAGMFVGLLEIGVMCIIWIGKDTAQSIIASMSSDHLPGGEDE
ncbi:polyisoprenoid diphosphate/phosphate phosphohydrolase PLPP6 [Musca vetustissima]|uniref:polyisoprenoid diphosphate/phosphate phosphohydrolase PLPP6 n=1 Tax=Musca vetustissima TaxID=27455 RepID=UPI002AB642CE|nr:polyisoprenoid diphosphate/phosphate phosphohydrolase PLPP6 [Musca vetustissima]